MELTEKHKEIITGQVCPYCNCISAPTTELKIYGRIYKNRSMICCINFPACDSYVGCHEDGTSLGRLANKNLRELKKKAHDYFDILWKNKHIERTKLYETLSIDLEIPIEYTHIGMFSENTCKKVIEWSKNKLKNYV